MNVKRLSTFAVAACMLAAPAAMAQGTSQGTMQGSPNANGMMKSHGAMTHDGAMQGRSMSNKSMHSGSAMSDGGTRPAGSGNGTGATERGGAKN